MSATPGSVPRCARCVLVTRYAWVNETFGVVEGSLNTTTDQAIVRAYACENELALVRV